MTSVARWRTLAWNVLGIATGTVFVALAAEAYIRATVPFMTTIQPSRWVPSRSWIRRTWAEVARDSWLVQWLRAKKDASTPYRTDEHVVAHGEMLSKDPRYAQLFKGWRPSGRDEIDEVFESDRLPPIFEDALEYTYFALEQFKVRTDRDGAHLVLLASHRVRRRGGKFVERVSEMAGALGIPVVDQAEYILRQGAQLADAQWDHNSHWNAAGHRWAAEALLEYIAQHQEVCDGSR